MGRARASVFLTFVLCVLSAAEIRAAVDSPSPDFSTPETSTKSIEKKDEMTLGTFDVATPPQSKNSSEKPEREYFYPYRKAITVRAGQGFNSQTVNGTTTPSIMSTQFFVTTQNLKSYEASADLLSDGTGMLQLAARHVLARSKFRPYWKLGGAVVVIPSEQLVTFIKYQNYRLESAYGAEYLIRNQQSLRVELEAFIGVQSIQVMATVGYVFAW